MFGLYVIFVYKAIHVEIQTSLCSESAGVCQNLSHPSLISILFLDVAPPCPRDFIGHSDSCYHSAHIKATWPEAIVS